MSLSVYAATKETEKQQLSIFKRIFKAYKRRDRPLDLSDLIDPLKPSTSSEAVKCVPFNERCLNGLEKSLPGLRPIYDWRLTTFAHKPGLDIISGMLSQSEQLLWIKRALLDYPEPPNVTNLHVQPHNPYKGANVFKTCGPGKLRWATLGNDYNWESKEYATRARQPLPIEMSKMAQFVVQILGLGPFNPDAAIVNYYPEKAYLSPHVDRSERDLSRPLVSLSFGQPAIYLTGGLTLDDPVDALMLRSGDVLVMSGPQRLVYHAVPRVLEGHPFDGKTGEGKEDIEDEQKVLDYANKCRLNITIRQVADEANEK